MDPVLTGFVRDFKLALRDFDGNYQVEDSSFIRIRIDRFCYCPITLVYFHRFQRERIVQDAWGCAKELGIPQRQAGTIIDASDNDERTRVYLPNMELTTYERELRTMLLDAINNPTPN